MRKKQILCSLILFFLFGIGCRQERKTENNTRPYIVATTGMIADITRKIGKKWVNVECLMGPSVDPHLYKASASDTFKLAQAKLILYNGVHLEGKLQGVLEKISRYRPVVAVSEKIPHHLLMQPEAFKGFHDPHIWFDVSLWRRAALRVATALIKLDPIHKRQYQRNANRYTKKLLALHHWVKRSIQLIPKGQRYLITSHDAFGYFGRAYGLKVVGLQGMSTVAEAGVKDVERIIQLLVSKKITAIFSETSVSDRMVQAVIQGCASRNHTVKIGGRLYSDAMGKDGTQEGTYIGMVQANVRKIVLALGHKKAPAFVFSSKPTHSKPTTRPIHSKPTTRPIHSKPTTRLTHKASIENKK